MEAAMRKHADVEYRMLTHGGSERLCEIAKSITRSRLVRVHPRLKRQQ